MVEKKQQEPESTSTAVVKSPLETALRSKTDTLLAVLRGRLDLDYLIATALLQVSENEYTMKIAKANTFSFAQAVVKIAEFGLSFAKGQAFLVPFGDAIVGMPGYQGRIQIMLRGQTRVHDVQARIVYQNEPFKITYGTNPDLYHVPIETEKERGPVRGAYAIAFYKDGTQPHPEYMPIEELLKIREDAKRRNKGRESPAYKDWESEMYKRAPINRLFKFLPQTEEATRLLTYEDEILGYNDDPDDRHEQPKKPAQSVKDHLRKRQGANQTPPSAPEPRQQQEPEDATFTDIPPDNNPPPEKVDRNTGEILDEKPAEQSATPNRSALGAFIRDHGITEQQLTRSRSALNVRALNVADMTEEEARKVHTHLKTTVEN